jgi:hypothetical protein
MAKDQVLEGEVPVRANYSNESAESEPKQFEHPLG